MVYRSALYGEVDGTQVACTHMTDIIPAVPYAGEHENWEG